MSSTPFPPSSLRFWCTCPSAPHTHQNTARQSPSGSIVFAVHREGFVAPVLAYAIEFFQTHQSAPAAKWLETDGELTSLHFAFAHQPQPSSRPPSPKKSTGNNSDLSQYRCKNFNRPGGCKYSHFHKGSACPHQHVCYNCGDAAHISPSCPTNPGLPPPPPSHSN